MRARLASPRGQLKRTITEAVVFGSDKKEIRYVCTIGVYKYLLSAF